MKGEQKPQHQAAGGGSRSGGFFPNSKRAISSYWRFVSSGASTVASTVRSAGVSVASSVATDKDTESGRDLVVWAGFDKLEVEENNIVRRVLLVGYRTGFQVWDVEEANNVREIVCKQDGPVSFLQMQPKLITSKRSEDKFLGSRPLLVVTGDATVNGFDASHGFFGSRSNANSPGNHDLGNVNCVPTSVRFYSLRSHSYVHTLKFRSSVHSVRCSARIVAVAQAAQIHCFDAATLESVYIVVIHPIVSSCHGPGSVGYGPLAVGSRWLAHTGNPVIVSNIGRVNPQNMTPPSNGSLVAHYAKESSRHLAAGILTIGDMGYKKLSKYCSELLPDINNTHRKGSNGHYSDAENAGFVIVRDVVHKSVVSQFRAHKSPISALCFDPSGTLLVTASVQGHNINVFQIIPAPPGSSSESDLTASCVHLYRLQRGITNAIIQDISFSNDSKWVMISSSRGTGHLFSIGPFGGNLDRQSAAYGNNSPNDGVSYGVSSAVHQPLTSGPSSLSQHKLYESVPITLSAVSRIKNINGWRDAVNGAAAAATGRVNSVSGAVASAFHYCSGGEHHEDFSSLVPKYHLLVFTPTGSVIQYAVRVSSGINSGVAIQSVPNGSRGSVDIDDRKLHLETLQKWDVCCTRNKIEREENIDTCYDCKSGDVNMVGRKHANGSAGVHHSDKDSLVKGWPNPQESHHLYISKAELHMHQSVPLWARSQIYFQGMLMDGIPTKHVDISCGEIEIERIPTRNIEARTKNLVPAVDYPQGSNFQKPRAFRNYSVESLPHIQKHGRSDDDKLLVQNSCSSTDVLPEVDASTETSSSSPFVEENGWGDLLASTELSGDFVSNDERLMKERSHHRDGYVSD